MAHRVTWNSYSNFVSIEGLKNGSLTFCSRNWIWNIFPISRDQSSKNQILGKKIGYWLVTHEPLALWKSIEMRPSVPISTITFERYGILKCGQNVLESRHSELEFGDKLGILLTKIKRVIVIRIWATELPDIRIPIMCRLRGVKMEDWRFVQEIGLEIFFLYREINHPKIKFWEKNMLVASYSWALITLEMCWKVNFGHRFYNNFWTVRNS